MVLLHPDEPLDCVRGDISVDYVVVDAAEEDEICVPVTILDEMAEAFTVFSGERGGGAWAGITLRDDVALLSDYDFVVLSLGGEQQTLLAGWKCAHPASIRPQPLVRLEADAHRRTVCTVRRLREPKSCDPAARGVTVDENRSPQRRHIDELETRYAAIIDEWADRIHLDSWDRRSRVSFLMAPLARMCSTNCSH